MGFLTALQRVRSMRDSKGISYACFGHYGSHNATCRSQCDIVCRVVYFIPSYDWISRFIDEIIEIPNEGR